MTYLREVLFIICAAFSGACGDGQDADPGGAELDELSGEVLAQRYCQGCHLLPDPASLDKASWKDAVLPMMGWRYGIYSRAGLREDSVVERGPGGYLVEQAGLFPAQRQIPSEAWEKIVDYYVSSAPERLPAPAARQVRVGLDRFRVRIPAGYRPDPPMISLVRIVPGEHRIHVGDVKRDFSTLDVLDLLAGESRPVQTLGMESPPIHGRLGGDRLDVLLIGSLLPTNEPSGLLRTLHAAPDGDGYGSATQLIRGLHRPVHVSYGDLDADGLEDIVVSEFGYQVGRLAWYQRTATGQFTPHVLKPLPGAVATHIRDLDADGRPDILALMSQGAEGIYLFRNLGGGRFEEKPLLRFPAAYGSTSFELHDFNEDGKVDILYTNGDNGDYAPVAKPYHGVRIFLNDGRNAFDEASFFPLHGAYGARARDFDGDGDLDVAAVAFYPEYRNRQREGFVYLENRGGLTFAASTFAGVDRGRWMTFDVGDLEGDGDEDIVLGSFVAFDPIGDTTGLYQRWLRESPAIVLLENTTR